MQRLWALVYFDRESATFPYRDGDGWLDEQGGVDDGASMILKLVAQETVKRRTQAFTRV
ncbi:MAG TPA: hypothetical protein VF146_16625 [Bryobacteraceae bacterium]